MKKRYFYIIWVLLIATGIFLCLDIKKGLETIDYSNIGHASVYILNSRDGAAADQNTPWRFDERISFKEMKDRSDLIIRAKAAGSRGKNNCALTEVEILRVYQGEGLSVSDNLKVYEWGELRFQHLYYARDGYTIMLPGREYFLFLNRFNNPYSGEEAWLLTNVIYGKVITEWPLDWRSIEADEAETMVYSQMWDWGIITADEAIIECYKEIYESIMLLEADS